MTETESGVLTQDGVERACVSAGDYFNKVTGERLERECREKLALGCTELIVDFSDTEMVNSVGVSILLGVIDSAKGTGARVVLSGVNAPTIELFEMLGVTKHAEIT